MPSLDAWLHAALRLAEQDGQQGARPVIEALAASAAALRRAAWNADASRDEPRGAATPREGRHA